MKWYTKAILLVAVTAPLLTQAESVVVQIRRNIPMSDTDPIYRDVFISNPTEAKLKKNMVVKIIRNQAVREAGSANLIGEIALPVAMVKILEVSDKIAVAREVLTFNRKEFALLDTYGIMMGDIIDSKDAKYDKRKSAQIQQFLEKIAMTGENLEDEQ